MLLTFPTCSTSQHSTVKCRSTPTQYPTSCVHQLGLPSRWAAREKRGAHSYCAHPLTIRRLTNIHAYVQHHLSAHRTDTEETPSLPLYSLSDRSATHTNSCPSLAVALTVSTPTSEILWCWSFASHIPAPSTDFPALSLSPWNSLSTLSLPHTIGFFCVRPVTQSFSKIFPVGFASVQDIIRSMPPAQDAAELTSINPVKNNLLHLHISSMCSTLRHT